LAEKSKTLVETGGLPAWEKLKQKVPPTLLLVMRIPGLGARKTAALHRELGVVDLASLRAACEQHRVRDLKGFGTKTEDAILAGLALAEKSSQRMQLGEVDALVQRLRDYLSSHAKLQRIDFAGSYRRGRETVGDLDVLVISDDASAVMDALESFPGREETIQRGDTKMSIRVHNAFQVDLRVVPKRSWGAALQYFTGSKEHNVLVRTLAKKKGLRINEYGVFRSDDLEKMIAGGTEEEVYASIGMKWMPPELREARFEFEGEAPCELPDVVQLTDIRGDLHMHTTDTDGADSMESMARAAQDLGLEYIAITDHSKRVSMARGLDADRLLKQWEHVDRLNATWDGKFHIFKGIECDILEEGGMDLPDDILRKADWVMASVHYGQRQSRDQITGRIVDAMANPWVSALSHPTGRLLGRREAYEVDIDAVIRAASDHGKMLELNAHPIRLDLNDVACMAAKRAGVLIVISTDAHSTAGLDHMRFGVLQARRAGLTKADVFNAQSLKRATAAIRKSRAKPR
jgi:DNA polymerase (family 10)